MWVNEWCKHWLGRATTYRGHRSPVPPRRGLRLRLEQLEDRTVPSSLTASSVSDLIADVNAVNLTAEADTITLASGTPFTLTTSTDGLNGLPIIRAAGGSLTIIGNGDVVERSMATGTPSFRLLTVAPGGSLTLENLTLQGGLAGGTGGAIENGGTLILDSVIVQNNIAQGSDAFYVGGWFGYWPASGAAGGGVWSSGALTIRNSTITGNTARGGDSNFNGVDAGDGRGGGLFIAGGTVTILNTSVTKNVAQGGNAGSHKLDGQGIGGGIYIDTDALAELDMFTIQRLKSNHASTSGSNTFGSYQLIS